ncbi:hypothetical protein [Streptosporangium canum]|uniref:hypothetical protein n=1 Tax=Streptosporangium canum TaxID=324952 RepID=UPI003796F068
MQTLTDLVGGVPQILADADAFMADHPVVSAIIGVIAVALLILGYLAVRAAFRAGKRFPSLLASRIPARPAEDLLTIVSAAIATGVSAQGMWQFSGDVLGFSGPLRLLLFAFIEVAVITSAVRARRNMRENFSAGIDGMAVWVLTCLTAVLSSMDARSIAEALFRLAAPLVAAWLWERGMAVERHRITGRTRINWRITPERVLVRFGLAEAKDRTADEVDTRRRFDRVALAAKRVRALREAGAKPWRIARAKARLERRYATAHAHTGIGRDAELQRALASEIASLYSAGALVDLEPASAWAPTISEEPSDFARLADETRDLKDSLAVRDEIRAAYERIRASEANILMLTSNKTGRSVADVTSDVTSDVTRGVTHMEVTSKVTKEVTDPPFFAPREWLDEAADVTSNVTSDVTVEQVTDEVTKEVTFDVTNRALFDLRWPPLELSDVTPPVTPDVTPDEVTDEVTSEVTGTAAMRAHWDAAVEAIRSGEVDDTYPSVTELAGVGKVHHSHASRLRKEWVAELTWRERIKANAKPKKAVNGSPR